MSETEQPTPSAYRTRYTKAKIMAVVITALAGIGGGLIGYALVQLQCTGECDMAKITGGVTGAILAAVGVGIVCTLALRALMEWRAYYPKDQVN